jgi:hypothetical protein
MEAGPVSTGLAFTVNDSVVLLHPVAVLVNVNVTIPADTPVTNPVPGLTPATFILLLLQVPATTGVTPTVVVPFAQIVVAPVMLTTGSPFTVTGLVVVLLHPVAVSVKVKYAVPADIPVTTPASVTVAITGLLLAHVPTTEGVTETLVLPFSQIEADPVIFTTGRAFTVTKTVLLHPEVVKVSVAFPGKIPVTTPALFTEATPVLLLDHPLVAGDTEVVLPTHIEETSILISGIGLTVIFVSVEVAEHPSAAVTITE